MSVLFLLLALGGVFLQILKAQDLHVRCSCPKSVKFTRFNVTDFQVLEPRSGCDRTELILSVAVGENSTERLCVDPVGKMAKAFFKCWENKNKNETRKQECLDRKRRTDH